MCCQNLAVLKVDIFFNGSWISEIWSSWYVESYANEIEIGDALYERMDKLNAALPYDLEINIGYDATLYMRNAIKEIFTTLIETVLLVGLVVVAMMGSFRTAMVPLITIPISILGAIAVMAMMGTSNPSDR